MKALLASVSFLGLAGAWSVLQTPTTPYVLVISGDTRGYLTPCGCTSPMNGGILRRATAISQLGPEEQTIYLDNGGLVDGRGDQDLMKAETLVQALHKMHVKAINLSLEDARLGRGAILSLARLSGDKLTTGILEPSAGISLPTRMVAGPFLVVGVASRASSVARELEEEQRDLHEAVDNLVREAETAKKRAIVLLQGPQSEAESLAREFPTLAAVVYSSASNPAHAVQKVGDVVLLSPGDRGKYILTLDVLNGKLTNYRAVQLGPEYADDAPTKTVYSKYLRRIVAAGLLDKMPRPANVEYVGPEKCASCHQEETKVWKRSGHFHALATLEKVEHDRDPDCVKCHVTGLDSKQGFRSRLATPRLANVTCESCHGSAANHLSDPSGHPMPKVGEKSCLPCHTSDNSPNFTFEQYWPKIRH